MSEPEIALPPPPVEEPVFWGYDDLAAFLLLAIPSMAAGYGIVAGFTKAMSTEIAESAWHLLAMQFLAYGIWFGSLVLLLRVRYNRPFWRSLGWTRPNRRHLWISAALGPVLALLLAVTAALLETPTIESPIEKLISGRRSMFAMVAIASTIGPLCEELAFRGFILPLLARTLGAAPGIILTAVPFALLHGPQYQWQWQIIVLLTFAGASFGYTRYYSGSLIPAFVMHATYNLMLFVGYLLNKELMDSW